MSSWLIRVAQKRCLVPQISETERQALEAGTVWWDGELFSGRPDLAGMLAEPWPELTAEEQAFLDGPVEEACRLVDPWELERRRELPGEVWELLRRERFFGLAIPREYGGHAFSPLAISTVFGKLASRSLGLSTVVLIPNSVGPAELLLEYGTEKQKSYYLPRLARGDEIPCFALTEPEAGSDAASLTSRGVLFRDGDGRLAIRLDWEKRYITLAPIATLLGLAFRLEDPDNLLGRPEGGGDVGITVALVPTDLPGAEVGRRHDPMGIPFPNGPTRGRSVVISAEQILGGTAGAGWGWKMLMEALSGGRAISLPAQSVGGAKMVARIAGAYASVRRQFGVEIGRFEGIEEPLARIAGSTYLMEAARVATCGAVGAGQRPAVVSGIVKVHLTELSRRLVADAMDVLAGAALCRGPRNLLASGYLAAPIGITVEGANILTRSLILFGQGAVRCHPYARREMEALAAGDGRELRAALLGHAGHLARNLLRAALLGLTRGRLARSPVAGPTARYHRRLTWASARFAVLADLAMLSLGSRLKLREKLSGRFADVLSHLFLGIAALRRFEAEGRREEDLPLARWAAEESLARAQEAFEGIYRNFEGPVAGPLLRTVGLFLCRINPLGRAPSDRLGAAAAATITRPGAQRQRLTAGIFVPRGKDEPLARLEEAFRLAIDAAPLYRRLVRAVKKGELPPGRPGELLDEARDAGLLEPEEAAFLRRAEAARLEALAVDEQSAEEYFGKRATADPAAVQEPVEPPVEIAR